MYGRIGLVAAAMAAHAAGPMGRSSLDPTEAAWKAEGACKATSWWGMSQMGVVGIRDVVRVVVGVAAVVAQIALAFFYIGWAMFVVPPQSIFVLACIWVAGIVAVIWLAIRDAWLAPLIPLAWFIVVMLMFEYGKANLGWEA